MGSDGELAIVLHTHMPYVERHGTWPFGEEWLWEATATSYVPILNLFDELGTSRTRTELTLSLTPVLCDQLASPQAMERCVAFLRSIRPESHRLDIEGFRSAGDHTAVRELERSRRTYADVTDRIAALESSGGVVAALGRHATWTSSATHAILPLLLLDEAIELQVKTGVESFRTRFGAWGGGFWLPECAHHPELAQHLSEAGVHSTCVEFTNVFGRGDRRHLSPLQPDEGPVLWSIDRQMMDLVWSGQGYPSGAAYRDYHRRSVHDHHVWANDGSHYDPDRAGEQVAHDAAEFVRAASRRVADGGVSVFAIDTELLGHWWHEGPLWLRAVIAEADAQGLRLTALNEETVERHRPRSGALEVPATSWGAGGDLRTWSGPKVAEFAWRARTAELMTFTGPRSPSDRALRELLALQSSDWAFLAEREWAGDYPQRRAAAHADALSAALSDSSLDSHLGNLAPRLART
jgi:1,4-alpha-glucan branching enzyme